MASGNYPLLNSLSYDEVVTHLQYSPSTGILIRLKSKSKRVKPGDIAGYIRKDGYVGLSLLCNEYLAHRIAWLLYYKEWPTDEVDHIDGNRANNKINNLRLSNRYDNNRNRHGPTKANKLGVLGVHQHTSGRYVARVRHKGESLYVGIFDSPEEAHAAYLEKKRELHPSFTL